MTNVHFEGVDTIDDIAAASAAGGRPRPSKEESTTSLLSAPPAPPHQHRRTSIQHVHQGGGIDGLSDRKFSMDDDHLPKGRKHRFTATFGGVSKRTAYREMRQARKRTLADQHGWPTYIEHSFRWPARGSDGTDDTDNEREMTDQELSALMDSATSAGSRKRYGTDVEGSELTIPEKDERAMHLEALKEMFTENKINVCFVFLPFAYWSHAHGWSDGSVFILNFLAMVPLASMLGMFTEELAAHTNDVIGGLINATFGNAVELVVAIQALLANDFRVVQASLIGSVFSNLLLVLGMCFYCGGIKYSEQEFIAQGAVASIALLAFCGMILLMPEFFAEAAANAAANGEEVIEGEGSGVELTVSRIGAGALILMYAQLLFFQLKTHVHLFEGDGDVVALIPFNWALAGLVIITAMVTILSEWLVGSIDGFCEEFSLGRSFVGVIILPVVGNAVEHISAVSVAMKNKMDLALGVALGSAVQIGLFVLPAVVVIGWCTGSDMSLKFPKFEVYLYLLSVIIVSLCLTNQRSNWLEGSLLVFTYFILAVGIYFEKDE